VEPIELVYVTRDDLQAELEQLAQDAGYRSACDLGAAIESGLVSRDSWAAWEYRSLRRVMGAEVPLAAE
jgi:hypothetical protein